MQYCSLQHWTLLLSPVTSTAGYCFSFGSIPSFFLELFLHWSPVAYWAPTDLGSSFFSILSFCLFILFMGFSRQEYWSGLPFPSPVDHILSDLSTMTCPSWVAPRAWLSFIELDKAVVLVIRWTSFLWVWFQCVCPLMPSCNTYTYTSTHRATWVLKHCKYDHSVPSEHTCLLVCFCWPESTPFYSSNSTQALHFRNVAVPPPQSSLFTGCK